MAMATGTAATIAAVSAVAGAGMSAIGAYQQAQSAKAQARYQAAVANNNAIIAQQNADRIRQNMEQAEDEQRERIKMVKGSARATAAANGLLVDDTSDATISMIQQDIMEQGEYDILKLRDNYEQEARAAEIQGINYQAEAGLQQLKASSYNGAFAAAGSLLSSAGTVYKAGKGAEWWA